MRRHAEERGKKREIVFCACVCAHVCTCVIRVLEKGRKGERGGRRGEGSVVCDAGVLTSPLTSSFPLVILLISKFAFRFFSPFLGARWYIWIMYAINIHINIHNCDHRSATELANGRQAAGRSFPFQPIYLTRVRDGLVMISESSDFHVADTLGAKMQQ